MTYRVRLYCRDCTGIDPMGCFDGGTELLESDTRPFIIREFDSTGAASAAGARATTGAAPWEYEVIDESGEVVG